MQNQEHMDRHVPTGLAMTDLFSVSLKITAVCSGRPCCRLAAGSLNPVELARKGRLLFEKLHATIAERHRAYIAVRTHLRLGGNPLRRFGTPLPSRLSVGGVPVWFLRLAAVQIRSSILDATVHILSPKPANPEPNRAAFDRAFHPGGGAGEHAR